MVLSVSCTLCVLRVLLLICGIAPALLCVVGTGESKHVYIMYVEAPHEPASQVLPHPSDCSVFPRQTHLDVPKVNSEKFG